MGEADGSKVFLEALERAKKIAKQLAESGKRSAPEDDAGAAAQPQKRFSFGPPGTAGMNGTFIPNPGMQTQEEWTVPNRMVGLIIGKGGENISRIQDATGAKLQLGHETPGPNNDKRSCTIYGTPAAIAKCKEMVNEIIDKEGVRHNPHNPTLPSQQLGITHIEVHVPKHKVGQIIGKGGETIRSLQDKARVRMFLIQDGDPNEATKPIKITGDPERVEHARRLVEEMIAMPDGPGGDRGGPGQVQEQMKVPRGTVGVIIGKGGETIRDIQNDTGARIQFIENPQESDKTCLISGRPGQVQEARRMIENLLQNSQQAKGGPMRQKYECEEVYKVPASKTGVIIGKGGETIRQICDRSGAKVELDRNHPATAEDRIFHMRGSRQCVEAAKRLIEEKLNDQARGNYDNDRRGNGNPWDSGSGGLNWDPNAAAAGDPAAAFWNAYCQQYYATMGAAMPAGLPGQPMMIPGMPNPYMPQGAPQPGMPGHPEVPPAPPAAPGDPNAASYYYQAATNPNQPVPASAAAVTTTEDGGQDFSRAWVEYYRSVGMMKEADDLEATLKAKENQGH